MLKAKDFIKALFIISATALGVAFIPPVFTRADEDIPVEELSEDLGIQDPENAATPDVDPESIKEEDRLALEVRKHLKAYDEAFTIQITDTSGMGILEFVQVVKDKAVAHTGCPGEGDYISFNILTYGPAVNLGTGEVTFYTRYRMTKKQLEELNKKEDKILKDLKIDGKNDYQKIRAIYNYMTKNVKYDHSKKKDPIVYTPYAAIINKKAVCQGYAVATYNLMLKAGIDCRVITGGDHAWNIVKLEGKYYYIDTTWDAGHSPSKYKYFLKGEPFSKHSPASSFKTDAFKKKYPISKSAYKGNGKNSGNSKPIPTPTDLPTPTPTQKPLPNPKNVSYYVVEEECSLTVVAGDRVNFFMTGNDSPNYYESSDKEVFYQVPGISGVFYALKAGKARVVCEYTDYSDFNAEEGNYVRKKKICDVTVLYRDVTDSEDFWYQPTNYLTEKGVVKGYDDQTIFKPANNCTRAQMVTFIWRLQGEPEPESTTCKFKDVKEKDYFYKACIWGNENHIVEGYKDGTFGPQIVCARMHAVTFLWRLAGEPDPQSDTNKFKDVKEKDYFYTATLWASEQGILAGYKDGTFKPNGDCLRRQMVTFLYKYDICEK